MAARLSHIIQQGDTLQSIAATKLHNVSRWTELISLNDLQFPYIVRTNREKSKNPMHWLTTGDTIYLPTYQTALSPLSRMNIKSKTGKHVYDDVLGMDLQLGYDQADSPAEGNSQGDQVAFLTLNKKQNDIARVSGIHNLAQSISNRLITQEGEMPYHNHYGSRLNLYIGTKVHTGTVMDIRNEITRTIYTDPRVQRGGVKINRCELYNENFFALVTIQPIAPYSAFSMYIDSVNGSRIETSIADTNIQK